MRVFSGYLYVYMCLGVCDLASILGIHIRILAEKQCHIKRMTKIENNLMPHTRYLLQCVLSCFFLGITVLTKKVELESASEQI